MNGTEILLWQLTFRPWQFGFNRRICVQSEVDQIMDFFFQIEYTLNRTHGSIFSTIKLKNDGNKVWTNIKDSYTFINKECLYANIVWYASNERQWKCMQNASIFGIHNQESIHIQFSDTSGRCFSTNFSQHVIFFSIEVRFIREKENEKNNSNMPAPIR